MTENLILNQTLKYTDTKMLEYLRPTNLPRPQVHEDKVSRPMTHLLANLGYYSFYD